MILIISAVFPPEPVVSAQISEQLACALSEKNEVVVLCPKPTRPSGMSFTISETEKKPFRKTVLNSFVYSKSGMLGRMVESISFGRECARFIGSNNSEISVIYANTWPLFAQFYVAMASRRYKIPLVLHIQDIYPETLSARLGLSGFILKKLLMPMDRFVLRQSNLIVAIGNKMADHLAKTRKINRSKIEVIYNWQDESLFKDNNTQSFRTEDFTFMFHGSLSPSANVEGIINAFGHAGIPITRLIIAGNGSSKASCIKTAEKYPGQKIEFWDAPSEKAPYILSMADILLLPLKKGVGRFSSPSKLSAYMLSAKPVLAWVDINTDAADIISKASCGWIVDQGNIESLSLKLKEIVNLTEIELIKFGQLGRLYALKNLSKKSNLPKLVQLVNQSIQ